MTDVMSLAGSVINVTGNKSNIKLLTNNSTFKYSKVIFIKTGHLNFE